jgi:hypothetical protein
LVAPITALALAASVAAHAVPQHQNVQTETSSGGQTINSQQIQELPLSSDEYGAGAYRLVTLEPGGQTAKWQDFDANKNLREDDIFQYTGVPGGASQKTEEQRNYYSEHGAIEEKTITDWNLGGGLSSYRLTDYDFRGNRICDHISKYELHDHIESSWNPQTYNWDTTTIPYKLPVNPSGAAANPPNYYLPQSQRIGLLLGRDYKFGDTISGSLWKSDYAEAFKTVPGLYEYSFPTQAYTLPDNSLSYAGLEIGVMGYGYVPVGSDGIFSLHLPFDFKNTFQFQVRQDDAPAGSVGASAQIPVDPPTAAPAPPQNMVSSSDVDFVTEMQMEYLIHLWNYAYDLELEWDEADYWGASDAYMDDLERELGDVYEEIDSVASHLPKDLVVNLAHELADETRANIDEIRSTTPVLTDDQISQIGEDRGWVQFLNDEAQARLDWGLIIPFRESPGFWTSPAFSQGSLDVVHGPFSGYGYDYQLHIGDLPVSPITETPNSLYFMPPVSLTPGVQNFQIGGYGTPLTTMPVFYMTLAMWADQTNLHKGQSTMYHLKLSGLNGMPSSAWNSSFYSSDLIAPSDLQGSPPDSSRKGTITLTITNQTPGVITMKNVYAELDAQSFAPSGTFQFDGGVGAITDGSFGIVGIARPFLQPVWSWSGALPSSLTNPAGPSLGQTYGLTPSWLGPSSIAAPTDLPACNLTNGCLGYDALRIYNQFSAAPNSTSAENPPAATRDDVQTRVTDAQQAVKDWTQRCKDENNKASAAWAAGFAAVPQAAQDAMLKTGQALDKTGTAERLARAAYTSNSSAANQTTYQSAMAQSANAREDYDAARSAVEDRFSPAQRAAFQAADANAKTADYYRARAEEELRDAHNTAGQFKPNLDIKYLF